MFYFKVLFDFMVLILKADVTLKFGWNFGKEIQRRKRDIFSSENFIVDKIFLAWFLGCVILQMLLSIFCSFYVFDIENIFVCFFVYDQSKKYAPYGMGLNVIFGFDFTCFHGW